MKKGTPLFGTITDLDEKGRGILPLDNKTYSIPFTMPGDTIEATFQKRAKKKRIANLTNIISPAERRRETPCPHAGICGGCLWQHMDEVAERELKQMMINRSFEKHGHTERLSGIPSSTHQLHYRNRMDYAIGWKGEVGLRAYGDWNRYINLETCLLLDEATPTILKTVHTLMDEIPLIPWDNKFHRGNFRYLTIRRGEFTHERMILLLFHDLSELDDDAKQKIVASLAPLCTTLYLGEQPTITDTEYAETLELLHGKPFLRERINHIEYDIHPNSFFQTNSVMAEKLQEAVIKLIKPSSQTRVLDLYCGLGFFSLALAKAGARVMGIERMPESIEMAKQNAALNQLSEKTAFIATPVETCDWDSEKYDTVIIDPSRAGLHQNVIQQLIARPIKQLIYVSCNYGRFTEELKELKTAYRLTHLEAINLFPQTPHVEIIAALKG